MSFHLTTLRISFGPEQVADELRRLAAEPPQVEGSASPCESRRGAQAPDVTWEDHGPGAPAPD